MVLQEDAAKEYDTRLIQSGCRDSKQLNYSLSKYKHLLSGDAASTGGGGRASGPKVQSQYKGVSWNSACSKWVAVLWDRELKRARHIGSYESEEAAAKAYDKEALKMLGPQNAGLNFRESEYWLNVSLTCSAGAGVMVMVTEFCVVHTSRQYAARLLLHSVSFWAARRYGAAAVC